MNSFVSTEVAPAPPDVRLFIQTLYAQPNIKFSLQLTGGGAQIIPWLFTVPGASRCLLEGNIPYAKAALIGLIEKTPDKYASAETAADMASAALRRNVQLILTETRNFSSLTECHMFGVSCTAALVSQVCAQPSASIPTIHISSTRPYLHLNSFRNLDEERTDVL